MRGTTVIKRPVTISIPWDCRASIGATAGITANTGVNSVAATPWASGALLSISGSTHLTRARPVGTAPEAIPKAIHIFSNHSSLQNLLDRNTPSSKTPKTLISLNNVDSDM